MKYPLLLLNLILLFSACSFVPGGSAVDESQSQNTSTAFRKTEYLTEDPTIKKIMFSFSEDPHSEKFSCDQCHEVISGVVNKKLVLFNETTGLFDTISNSTELCLKCHPSQNSAITTSPGTQVAHQDFGCTNCHNAHKTQASCTQSACHGIIRSIITAEMEKHETHPESGDPNDLMCSGTACHDLAMQARNSPIYHQPIHRQVPCFVCHDISGLEIESDGSGSWFTIESSTPNAHSLSEKIISHQIGRAVDCSKCHYKNNPWELVENLSSN